MDHPIPSPGQPPGGRVVVEMTGIVVEFPGVRALDGVDLRLRAGEVHALMGENGAGKSTLIKALTGVHAALAGETRYGGDTVAFASPAAAQAAGISTVYQEVNLCGNLSVAENILLGREPRRGGVIDGRAMRRKAAEVLDRLGVHIDPGSTLDAHPLAVRQLVAIARAVEIESQVLILDEPTSSLDADEVAELFRIVRAVRDSGVAVLFVSHFIDQVYEISDRMTVLRNGKLVGEYVTSALSRDDLVAAMLGRELGELPAPRRADAAESTRTPLLRATRLGRSGAIAPLDLEIHPGEVIGVAGLLGSGRTELARLLFGADHADSGHLEIDGARVHLRDPRSAIAARIAFSSEDRKGEGLIGDLTVRQNIVLAMQAARGWARPIPRRQQDELVERYVRMLDIRPANPDALVRNLSGGNQQKVILARWLATQPRVLILDEPTRGIDIGAKTQIQRLVAQLAGEGMAVIFISAELEEVVRVSDRVVVLRDRRKVAELRGDDIDIDRILALIARGSGDEHLERSAS